MTDADLAAVAALLKNAARVLFITGAGVSADSGLPTYRGVGGLYEDADTPEGMPIEAVLSGGMMQRQPALVWKHLLDVERACRGARPNRAHEVMAALQDHLDVVVLTQNVDGLHRAAGSRDVVEIHGSVQTLVCTACEWQTRVSDFADLHFVNGVPPCPSCGSVVRPEVVLFDELLPDGAIDRLRALLTEGVDLVFSVGTTSAFPYIAYPVVHQVDVGKPAIEINPGRTDVSDVVTHRLAGGAAAVMDALWQRSFA